MLLWALKSYIYIYINIPGLGSVFCEIGKEDFKSQKTFFASADQRHTTKRKTTTAVKWLRRVCGEASPYYAQNFAKERLG